MTKKKALLCACTAGILITGSAATLCLTEWGTAFILDQSLRFVPELTLGKTSGSFSNLSVESIVYKSDSFELETGKTTLSLRLASLLAGNVRIESLRSENLVMKVLEGETENREDPESVYKAVLPVRITIDRVDIGNTTLDIGSDRYRLTRLETAFQWKGSRLTFGKPILTDFSLQFGDDAAESDSAGWHPETLRATLLDIEKNALFTLPADPSASEIAVDMVFNDLKLNRAIFGSADEKSPFLTLKDASLNGEWIGSKITIGSFETSTSFNDCSHAAFSGSLDMQKKWPLNVGLKIKNKAGLSAFDLLEADLSGELAGRTHLTLNTEGKLAAGMKADTSLTLTGLPFEGKLHLLRPFIIDSNSEQPRLTLSSGTLALSGSVSDWTLRGEGGITKEAVPDAFFNILAEGSLTDTRLSLLELKTEKSRASFTGDVSWRDVLRWKGEASLKNVAVSDFMDIPLENLSGNASLNGEFRSKESWHTEVPSFSLSGTYLDKPLKSSGTVHFTDHGRFRTPGIEASLADNKVSFKALLDQKSFGADLTVNAPRLSDFSEKIEGRLKGSILMKGNPEKPVFVADLKGSSLFINDVSIADAALKGEIRPNLRGEAAGNLVFIAKDTRSEEIGLKAVVLTVDGTEKEHLIRFGFKGTPLSTGIRLSGHFDRKTLDWKGQLLKARVKTPVGLFSQEKPTFLHWHNAESELSIGKHAWVHPDARLDFRKPIIIGKHGNIDFSLSRLRAEMFNPVLAAGTRLKGDITGETSLTWQEGSVPNLSLSLKSPVLTVIREKELPEGGESVNIPVPFRNLALEASFNRNQAELSWESSVSSSDKSSKNGEFTGRISVSDPTKAKILRGSTTFGELDLQLLNTLFTTGEKAGGTAGGSLHFGGTLEKPDLVGHLKFDDVSISEGMTPIEMLPSDILLRFTGTQSSLTGKLNTKHGELLLNGFADWGNGIEPYASLNAVGKNVEFTVPPYAHVKVSPNVSIRAQKDLVKLDGMIEIPYAKVTVDTLPPSSISVSRDEVMLNADLTPVKPKTARIPIESKLKIKLGRDVSLQAFGLDTKLDGEVRVSQSKRGLGLNGQLGLKEGRFSAYGQDLIVRRGNVFFTGPIDRPTFDILAVRNPEKTEDDVTAGLLVAGDAVTPKITVYSEPAMATEEALSYLLRGHGIEAGDAENDNAVLTAALINIGISQTGAVIGNIGDAFGIHDFGLDTAGTGDNAQIIVSGYLLPKLQVKYGVGLFDSLTTLTLRYRLMPKLFLESVSGVNESIDLLYRFEF